MGEPRGTIPGSPGVLVKNADSCCLPPQTILGGWRQRVCSQIHTPGDFSAHSSLGGAGLGFLALGMRSLPGLSDNGLLSGLPQMSPEQSTDRQSLSGAVGPLTNQAGWVGRRTGCFQPWVFPTYPLPRRVQAPGIGTQKAF